MKKVLKLFLLVIICGFVLVGCKKDEETTPVEKPVEDKKEELNKGITIEDMGVFDGEFGEKDGLIKVINNNDKAVYVRVYFEMLDQNKKVINTKEKFVRVNGNGSAYVLVRQEYDEEAFYGYNYTSEIDDDNLEEYDSIIKKIDISYIDSGNNIVVKVTNKGNRTTTVYGLLIFYKNNKIVAASEVTEYNLMGASTRNIEVRYPLERIGKNKSFDRIYLTVNEVSTEL